MSSHSAHQNTLIAGLADDCPRCAEQARQPLELLDDAHLAMCWKRMIEVETAKPFSGSGYRSKAEARACGVLYQHRYFLTRFVPLVEADSWPLEVRAPRDLREVACLTDDFMKFFVEHTYGGEA